MCCIASETLPFLSASRARSNAAPFCSLRHSNSPEATSEQPSFSNSAFLIWAQAGCILQACKGSKAPTTSPAFSKAPASRNEAAADALLPLASFESLTSARSRAPGNSEEPCLTSTTIPTFRVPGSRKRHCAGAAASSAPVTTATIGNGCQAPAAFETSMVSESEGQRIGTLSSLRCNLSKQSKSDDELASEARPAGASHCTCARTLALSQRGKTSN
mmetsp:Transcript_13539/g.34057  ORF Transcript_13539/g.34057 Transcript_13539/m.34057 type:complete len:217 (-) Transcript_13539:405-1055(-)